MVYNSYMQLFAALCVIALRRVAPVYKKKEPFQPTEVTDRDVYKKNHEKFS